MTLNLNGNDLSRSSPEALSYRRQLLTENLKMRLAAISHGHIESFLREHLGDEDLRLPPIRIYHGGVARRLTRAFNIGAITFGRRVFISPAWVGSGRDGRPTAPGWLIAHEAVHVLQYEREGFIRFLIGYLVDYFRGLRARGSVGRATRMESYLSIAKERDAHEAGLAYLSYGGLEHSGGD